MRVKDSLGAPRADWREARFSPFGRTVGSVGVSGEVGCVWAEVVGLEVGLEVAFESVFEDLFLMGC
jgi:hypothetical protein